MSYMQDFLSNDNKRKQVWRLFYFYMQAQEIKLHWHISQAIVFCYSAFKKKLTL